MLRHPGVRRFFREAATQRIPLFLSAITIGELVQRIHRMGGSTILAHGRIASQAS